VGRDKNLAALGREIRRLRKAQGLSQKQFQDAFGMHRSYLAGIERADRNVGMATIFRLARALGVHPSELLDAIP
jgi:transcriptional regulator with XRE-family HTH domain